MFPWALYLRAERIVRPSSPGVLGVHGMAFHCERRQRHRGLSSQHQGLSAVGHHIIGSSRAGYMFLVGIVVTRLWEQG